MKLWFNLALDGRTWPDVLGATGRSAVAGELWVGPHRLLDVLETQLGLVWQRDGQAARVAALVPALGGPGGGKFWSRSAEAAPFAVARTLLRWRDELMMWGWEPGEAARGGKGRKAGKKKSLDRLAQLAELVAGNDVLPGTPDRLLAVLAELKELDGLGGLAKDAITIEELVLFGQPPGELPTLWKRVLDALESACGVQVRQERIAPIKRRRKEASDLGQAFGFDKRARPRGDGSLQLVRPAGPLDAAEQVAVWLASLGDLDGTVIIGGDQVLDAALAAQGLPTTGAPSSADGDPLLQVLPMVVALGWAPPQPQVALDLLLLPRGPVPYDLAQALVGALQTWPAVGSDAWDEELAAGLEALKPKKERERVQARLEGIFGTGSADQERFTTAELLQRVELVDTWLRDEQRAAWAGDDPERVDRLSGALTQCRYARELAESSGLTELSEAQLRDVLDHAMSAVGQPSRFEAEVGLSLVSRPGAIAGPARRIVWWDFTRGTAARLRALPLSSGELASLNKAGVVLPDPGDQAERLSALWRRPFEQAAEALILVSPQVGVDGEEVFPHPIWDEVVAPLDDADKALLERDTIAGIEQSRPVELLPQPASQAVWQVDPDVPIPRSKRYSYSAFGKLLGCPLAWTLGYQGYIRPGASASLPSDSQLHGSLAHKIAEWLLLRSRAGEPLTPDQARAEAATLFDEQGPRLAAEVFAAGNDDERLRVRRGVVEGIGELFRQLDAAGATVAGVEEDVEAEWRDQRLGGVVDLLLAKPKAVVDLKWRGAKYRRQDLENGTAYQLATYTRMLQGRRRPPPVAYYTFTEQMLVTTSPDTFPQGMAVEGPGMDEVWQAVERAVDERWAELDDGRVWCGKVEGEGPGQAVVKKSTVSEEDILRLEAPCRFCDLAGLCLAGGDE